MGAVAAAAASAFAVPSFAFAAERETTGIGAILPQMDEFIPMLVAFIVIAIILGKFGWPAFDNVLKKREATIRESLEKSEAARIESERVLEEYKAELADAKKQAAPAPVSVCDDVIAAPAAPAGEKIDMELYMAVIGMALKQYEDDVHDVESGVITIKPKDTDWDDENTQMTHFREGIIPSSHKAPVIPKTPDIR
jgi:hypothetical protein